jgi:hypothetical protein
MKLDKWRARDSVESSHLNGESLLNLTNVNISRVIPVNLFALQFQLKAPDKQGESDSPISGASDSRPYQVRFQRPRSPLPTCSSPGKSGRGPERRICDNYQWLVSYFMQVWD